jgi:hypothetical protein
LETLVPLEESQAAKANMQLVFDGGGFGTFGLKEKTQATFVRLILEH